MPDFIVGAASRVRLIDNWRDVLKRGWSVWAYYASGIMAVAQWTGLLVGYVDLMPLIVGTIVVGIIVRLVKQDGVSGAKP